MTTVCHSAPILVTPKNQKPSPYTTHARQALTPDETACLEILLERWPDAFDLTEPVPLQIGIHSQIVIDEPGLAGPELDAVLRWYTARIPYVLAIAAGGKRAGLDGRAAGEVTRAQQNFAAYAVTNFNLRGRWYRTDWPFSPERVMS